MRKISLREAQLENDLIGTIVTSLANQNYKQASYGLGYLACASGIDLTHINHALRKQQYHEVWHRLTNLSNHIVNRACKANNH